MPTSRPPATRSGAGWRRRVHATVSQNLRDAILHGDASAQGADEVDPPYAAYAALDLETVPPLLERVGDSLRVTSVPSTATAQPFDDVTVRVAPAVATSIELRVVLDAWQAPSSDADVSTERPPPAVPSPLVDGDRCYFEVPAGCDLRLEKETRITAPPDEKGGKRVEVARVSAPEGPRSLVVKGEVCSALQQRLPDFVAGLTIAVGAHGASRQLVATLFVSTTYGSQTTSTLVNVAATPEFGC